MNNEHILLSSPGPFPAASLYLRQQRGNGCAETRILPPNPSVLSAFVRQIPNPISSLHIPWGGQLQHHRKPHHLLFSGLLVFQRRRGGCRTRRSPPRTRRRPPPRPLPPLGPEGTMLAKGFSHFSMCWLDFIPYWSPGSRMLASLRLSRSWRRRERRGERWIMRLKRYF